MRNAAALVSARAALLWVCCALVFTATNAVTIAETEPLFPVMVINELDVCAIRLTSEESSGSGLADCRPVNGSTVTVSVPRENPTLVQLSSEGTRLCGLESNGAIVCGTQLRCGMSPNLIFTPRHVLCRPFAAAAQPALPEKLPPGSGRRHSLHPSLCGG
jgi:hypothetical protein